MRSQRFGGELVTAPSEIIAESSVARVEPAATVGIGQDYLRYSSSTVAVVLARMISFPTLTRLIDNAQYVILSYYDAWLMIAVAVIKLGGQHNGPAAISVWRRPGADDPFRDHGLHLAARQTIHFAEFVQSPFSLTSVSSSA